LAIIIIRNLAGTDEMINALKSTLWRRKKSLYRAERKRLFWKSKYQNLSLPVRSIMKFANSYGFTGENGL